jgi:hypothetical protein
MDVQHDLADTGTQPSESNELLTSSSAEIVVICNQLLDNKVEDDTLLSERGRASTQQK